MLHACDGSLRRVATTAIIPLQVLACDGLELDALEKVFPDEQQRRIDNSDHQERKRDRVGRCFGQSEVGSPCSNRKGGGQTEERERGKDNLNKPE